MRDRSSNRSRRAAMGERMRTARMSVSTPRLEIDLDKLRHNARSLVAMLRDRGISVTGVTKATMGSPEIAAVWHEAGVKAIGEARMQGISALRRARVSAPLILIRSPMLSEIDAVVALSDVSCNTEPEVLRRISAEARSSGRTHGVVLIDRARRPARGPAAPRVGGRGARDTPASGCRPRRHRDEPGLS